MIPSLGRTVHYVLPEASRHKGQHRAAVISQVWADKGSAPTEETPVHLTVFNDTLNDPNDGPVSIVRNCVQDPFGKMPGSWHEPERAVIAEAAKPGAKAPKEAAVPA